VRTLVIAETVVDLVAGPGPRPSSTGGETSQPPFPGGTGANVAIHATRHGGSVILASGVGGDEWGRWLRRWLDEEGIDLSYFVELDGCRTPISEVSIEGDEPLIEMQADATPQILSALAPRLDRAVSAADAVFFASNTLCDSSSREITLRARDLALAQGKPVLVDFNYRPNRWSGSGEAARQFLEAAEGAALLKCNRSEAMVAAGETNLHGAAATLAEAGYQQVLITLGATGALLLERGGGSTLVPAPQVATTSTLGAGDALTGALLGLLSNPTGGLRVSGRDLERAVDAAARSTEYLGAVAPEA
jgi:sugar/nucleoside kinase (ribokinase family)